jgi:hypothetical protein
MTEISMRKLIALLALLAGSVAHGQGFNWPSGSGGIGPGSYPLLAPNGTLAAPSYAFAAQPGMGMYRAAAGDLRWTPDGTNYASLTSTSGISLTLNNVGNSTTGTVGSDGNGLTLQSSTNLITPGSDGAVSLGVGGARFNNGNFAGTVTATTFVGTSSDFYLSAYDAADNSTANKLQTYLITNASTLKQDAGTGFTGSVVGVGAGNYVVKLCSDGATCSGANLKATCTISCTATVGTTTACTVNNAAIAAATTLTLEPSTACATTAESGNFAFHLTTP